MMENSSEKHCVLLNDGLNYVLKQPFRYGVQDMDGSAKRICKAALGAPEDHLVILLAHNGPTGLSVCSAEINRNLAF